METNRKHETQALHIHGGAGSCIEWTLPMFIEQSGYRSVFTGQILRCDMTTSLEMRNFIQVCLPAYTTILYRYVYLRTLLYYTGMFTCIHYYIIQICLPAYITS